VASLVLQREAAPRQQEALLVVEQIQAQQDQHCREEPEEVEAAIKVAGVGAVIMVVVGVAFNLHGQVLEEAADQILATHHCYHQ
jgi:hypothetical protein